MNCGHWGLTGRWVPACAGDQDQQELMDAANAQGITEQLEPGKQLVEKQKVGGALARLVAACCMRAMHGHVQAM